MEKLFIAAAAVVVVVVVVVAAVVVVGDDDGDDDDSDDDFDEVDNDYVVDDDDDDSIISIVVGRTRESFDRKGDRSGRVRLFPLEIKYKWTSVPWGIQACPGGVVPTSGQSRVSGAK